MAAHGAAEAGDGRGDKAPGESGGPRSGLLTYLGGFLLSVVMTVASFWVATTQQVWAPGVPVLLAALAVGQMGVQLVFFFHITSGPEGTNNILALAFGIFVVGVLVFGSLVIMANLDANMLPLEQLLKIQR
ncbi:MAG: cytochrome o ubiquinol oxidase subunit IV [Rubrivivax sp.]